MSTYAFRSLTLSALSVAVLVTSCQSTTDTSRSLPIHANYQTQPKAQSLQVYTTAKDTELRLSHTATHEFTQSDQASETEVSVFVNPKVRFQHMWGVGGAITDASAEVFDKLSKSKQQELLRAYYDPEDGIGYTIARTTIHSADFSSGSYTYIDEGDKDLKTFSIEPDRQYRIPMIKQAIEAAGGELALYASPWSAPAFMKTNNHMLNGGKLLPEYHQAWALYYTKFIKAYESEGIPIWGITIQNEPMALQRWESMIYTAEEERDFLKNHLGPTMASEGLGDKNIVVWDHNRDLMSHRANVIFSDPEAAKYAWGAGFHWYEVWTGSLSNHANLSNVYQSFPDKHLLFTEGTVENFSAERYQHWPNAEKYGRSMVNDFNNGTVGWTDWNVLLDQNGGPNHVGNFCFAPIHADTQTGELIYTPTYYYIGHFSKFIRPNAQRLSTTTSRSQILATSFINEDSSVATVVLNLQDEEIKYNFQVGDDKEVIMTIPARGIQTLLY
ncbi:MAG: glycosyl hydrolase [Alteromonadaceae bacterium]|nr:MAG: glycosyl hydrolase [Alteromonadaceae bacterium]